jgi:bifunctional DNA-binding transcriptional regulator/antitoxin component of YhaV-PrlF toxin-antitoxin module
MGSVSLVQIYMTQIHTATLKVIQGGRITIPLGIREIENIQEGDYVKVTIEKIERQNSTAEVRGSAEVHGSEEGRDKT